MKENNEEKINFHDEEIQEVKKDYSKKALLGFLLAIIYLIIKIVSIIADKITYTGNINDHLQAENLVSTSEILILVIEILIFLMAIIIGAIALKEISKKKLKGKKYAVMAIVLPFIFFILSGIMDIVVNKDLWQDTFDNSFNCIEATDCKKNENGTYSCKYNDEEITCLENYGG